MDVISLFSGAMGLDCGLESAGMRTRVSVEADAACRKTIALNHSDVVQYTDIREVSGKELLSHTSSDQVVLAGGPPCQSFSTIGARKSVQDSRGMLVYEYLRVLREVSPDFFVFENVRGMLSAKKDDGLLWEWLLNELGKTHHVSWGLLNSNDYGSPQSRVRLIVVGSKFGEVDLTPKPGKRLVLGDAIKGLRSVGECGKFSERTASVLEKVPPGGNWKSLHPRLQDLAMGNANRASGGLTAFYRRLSFDAPCPTLLTSPTQRATTLCHPIGTRPLSVREYARVQGFPHKWKFSGSTSDKYRQIGNAVPVPLGHAIGDAIMKSTQL